MATSNWSPYPDWIDPYRQMDMGAVRNKPAPRGGVTITDRTGGKKSPGFSGPSSWSQGYVGQFGKGLGVIPTDQPPPGDTPKVTGPRRPTRSSSAAARAAAAAAAEAAAAMTRAGNRYKDQAANLDPQIAALKHALDVTFAQNRDANLADIAALVEEQLNMLKTQHGKRAKDFLTSGRNSENATAAQAEENIQNFVRERQDTMTAVLEQGAGHTDLLRGLVAAARNWQKNANEGNRAYFDSMQSVNAGINDLNMDTQTGLSQAFTSGESERERLWQDFYNRRSETFTQLGNLYQNQADYLDQAKEMKVGSGGGDKKTMSGTAFMDAAKEAGMSYKKAGLPDWIKDFEGQKQFETKVTNTDLAAAPKIAGPRKASGATLRRWG